MANSKKYTKEQIAQADAHWERKLALRDKYRDPCPGCGEKYLEWINEFAFPYRVSPRQYSPYCVICLVRKEQEALASAIAVRKAERREARTRLSMRRLARRRKRADGPKAAARMRRLYWQRKAEREAMKLTDD